MFENNTFEVILTRMLDRIPDSFDKREGSVIYDALAPAAAEMATMYIAMDNWLNESFADTASRDYLVRRAAEVGIEPYPATNAVMKGHFLPVEVQLTSADRFNLDIYNYRIKDNLGDGYYTLTCETPGAAPNSKFGDLTPIYEIPNLSKAEIVDCLIYGSDEEDTEVFRERYFKEIKQEAKDGNVADYETWCDGFPGIGNYRIFPLWNGVNTVKVSILDETNSPANDTLVSEFQNYLDPGSTGLGNGEAPIGSIVTVSTGEYLDINVSATVELKPGYDEISGIDEKLTDFLKESRYSNDVVHYFSVGCEILKVDCVASISNLLINGGTSDIELQAEQIPKFGVGTWTVANNG